MKILYITPLWSGVKPFFLDGEEKILGMPAFFNVFKSVIDDDRVYHVYIILFMYGVNQPILLPKEYRNKLTVYPIRSTNKLSFYKGLFYGIRLGIRLVKKNKIKSIYGQGTISAIASIVGTVTKVQNYRRIYGTFLYRAIQQNKSLWRSNFMEYLAFKMYCDGLIITNDGTHGDKVFQKVGNSNTKLYYLLNGLNKEQIGKEEKKVLLLNERHTLYEGSFFSYVARVDEWKRQHLLIEAIKELVDRGIKVPPTYIVGYIFSEKYNFDLAQKISNYNLGEKVFIVGPTEKSNVPFLLQKAIATFSLYDFSNLGNVFLEALAYGSLMIAINEEGSLDNIPSNTYLALKDADISDLTDKMESVLGNHSDNDNLRNNASIFAQETLISWDDRVQKEKQIVFGLS